MFKVFAFDFSKRLKTILSLINRLISDYAELLTQLLTMFQSDAVSAHRRPRQLLINTFHHDFARSGELQD